MIPIIMRNDKEGNLDIEDLESLNIYAQQTGKNVPLKQVADIDVVWQASKILRRDLYKTITITSDLQSGSTAQDVISQMTPWLKEAQTGWGIGYKYTLVSFWRVIANNLYDVLILNSYGQTDSTLQGYY